MDILRGVLMGLVLAGALVLGGSYVCFYLAFYMPEKKKKPRAEFELPRGKVYEPYAEDMIRWMKQVRHMPCEQVHITTFDGLTLWGRYYEYAPGAPVELMFHGYRGTAERDLCGGVQRCFELGHSALLVDQRAAGKSQGNVITFGLREHQDCLCWVEFMRQRFGQDVKILLCGISMGASTVLMAAGEELPNNVVGVLADCGFSSAKEIICKVLRQIRLPVKPVYLLIRLGAKLYGGFDVELADATGQLKKCKVPVLFFHGTADEYVPWEMSKKNYDACASQKKLVCIEHADHGLSYLVNPALYLQSLQEFEVYWGIRGKETVL